MYIFFSSTAVFCSLGEVMSFFDIVPSLCYEIQNCWERELGALYVMC